MACDLQNVACMRCHNNDTFREITAFELDEAGQHKTVSSSVGSGAGLVGHFPRDPRTG